MASGLVVSTGYTGSILGPPMGGYVLDLTSSLQISMIVLALVSVGGAHLLRLAGDRHHEREEQRQCDRLCR